MSFNYELIKWLHEMSNDFTDFLGVFFTMLGEEYIMIVVIAFFYFVFNKRVGEIIAYSLFISACFNNVLKGIIKAPRPFENDTDIIPKREGAATGYSFPSGHTQNGATFFAAIGLALKSKVIWIIIGVIITLIAFSRIYLGVHYLQDVLAGAFFGIGFAFLGNYLYNLVGDNYRNKAILFAITAIVFLPFVFIFYNSDYQALAKYRDFYLSYGILLGFCCAILVENKFVNFTCENVALSKRLIRFAIGLIISLTMFIGLKLIFPVDSIFFDFLRYFLVSFVSLGLFPLSFKYLKLL